MESEAIDIMMIDETHLWYNNQVDLSVFSGWRSVGREWGHPDKAGGGKLFLFSPRLVWQMWNPQQHDHEWINNEKS